MTTFTKEDRISAEQAVARDQCYLLAVKVIKNQLIPWPSSVDSETWTNRVNGLVSNLCIEFGYDGENKK